MEIPLTENELRSRLTSTEDSFVERKPKNQKGDWLQAVVAFANSTPVGYPAVLFIGVDDSGTIADDVDCEKVIKSFSDFVDGKVWPPIYTLARSLKCGDRSCVAVIVPGSQDRPHFAGRSYVRSGTQTKEASEQQFAELIAQRSSKIREMLAWAGKEVTQIYKSLTPQGYYADSYNSSQVFIESCNMHYLTLRYQDSASQPTLVSYSVNRIELSFDHRTDRLIINIYSDR